MAWLVYKKNARGVPVPEIWHLTDLDMKGKPKPCLHKVVLKPEDDGLSLDLLSRLYPCPRPLGEPEPVTTLDPPPDSPAPAAAPIPTEEVPREAVA